MRLQIAISSTAVGAMLLLASSPVTVLSAELTLPIFDTHLHYNADAAKRYSPADVDRLLAAANVPRALVSSTPDDGTLRLYRQNSARFVPILRPYRKGVTKYNWHRDQQTPAYLAARLRHGIYKGIGEFHFVFGSGAAAPMVQRVAELSLRYRIVLHVHSPALDVHTFFQSRPKLTILWAHAGWDESAAVVRKMLDRYPNLWVELSQRAKDVAPRGKLDPAWRALFEKYPHRFMIGSDTNSLPRWKQYRELIDEHRRWLKQLAPDIAVAIAHGNAFRMFGAGRVVMQ